MNRAPVEAQGQRVLFLDDDIIPSPGLLHAPWRLQTATGPWSPKIAGKGAASLGNQGQPRCGNCGTFRFNRLQNPARAVSSWEATSPLHAMAPPDLGGFDEKPLCVLGLSLRSRNLPISLAPGWVEYSLYFLRPLIDHLQAQRGGTAVMPAPHNNSADHCCWFRFNFRHLTQPLLPALPGMFKVICSPVG